VCSPRSARSCFSGCGAREWPSWAALLSGAAGSGILTGGSVSERPKERASKAREGSRPPWVQIPPLPPLTTEAPVTLLSSRSPIAGLVSICGREADARAGSLDRSRTCFHCGTGHPGHAPGK
jgi:hypothetical protein